MPAAKIIVDPPQPDQLARGVVIIEYRTENLQIFPVFGPAALAVAPRIGHLHVTADDGPWVWAHTSGQPLIIAGLPPGPHKIVIELADANHHPLAQQVVKFEVPRGPLTQPDQKAGGDHPALKSPEQAATAPQTHGSAAVVPAGEQALEKFIVDRPQPGPLSRGVAFISTGPRIYNLRRCSAPPQSR